MKAADAAAIRKQLGCPRICAAAGPRTHFVTCPNAGKWLDEAPRSARSRVASVPVSELEELVKAFRRSTQIAHELVGEAVDADVKAEHRGERRTFARCADDVQALIDKVTP